MASTGSQPFGPNRHPLLAGLSSVDGKTPTPVWVNPATGALITSSGGGSLVSAPLVGQSKIASTGTAVQLNGGTSQALTNGIILYAPSGNNASGVTVGGSGVTNAVDGTGNGYILAPGAAVSFAVTNTDDLYINGSTGDIVSWAGS